MYEPGNCTGRILLHTTLCLTWGVLFCPFSFFGEFGLWTCVTLWCNVIAVFIMRRFLSFNTYSVFPPTEKLTAASALLESFGNCRTPANANASRFTQISSLDFDPSGQVVSASVQVRMSLHSSFIHLPNLLKQHRSPTLHQPRNPKQD